MNARYFTRLVATARTRAMIARIRFTETDDPKFTKQAEYWDKQAEAYERRLSEVK